MVELFGTFGSLILPEFPVDTKATDLLTIVVELDVVARFPDEELVRVRAACISSLVIVRGGSTIHLQVASRWQILLGNPKLVEEMGTDYEK